ncbi:hypothetical protein [Nocardioides bruguierae]|uniref:hypothetical protein n=1 Tax=Nocardioides bruguierae TaxID=2945102 RepID=UPI00202064C6|nr:hypothetical protein [Nocardioides bruguierae]MCL8025691.1 hypothetical protein [Nocardioides bruguierae]
MALQTPSREHPTVDPALPAAPPATRARRPGWRDPRLWVGVAIVAASVLLGARVLAAADDTVTVWAAGSTAAAGSALDPDDLIPVQVRFADGEDLDAYWTADAALPAEGVLLRDVGAGELLPRAAVGEGIESGLVDVPVSVGGALLPASVRAGARVDVHLAPGTGATEAAVADARAAGWRPGTPVLADALVVEQSGSSGLAGAESGLVLRVEEDEAERWFALRATFTDAVVSVAVRP